MIVVDDDDVEEILSVVAVVEWGDDLEYCSMSVA